MVQLRCVWGAGVLNVTLLCCWFIDLDSKSGRALGHRYLPDFDEIEGLGQCCAELSLKFWKGPDAVSRRGMPSC